MGNSLRSKGQVWLCAQTGAIQTPGSRDEPEGAGLEHSSRRPTQSKTMLVLKNGKFMKVKGSSLVEKSPRRILNTGGSKGQEAQVLMETEATREGRCGAKGSSGLKQTRVGTADLDLDTDEDSPRSG